MKRYKPSEIEPKWQKVWAETNIYEAKDTAPGRKNYILDFFPYPSGAAMHVGHVRNYTISDVLSRYARQRGDNVLHPMGWDAFGLPAENFAIKTGVSPQQAVAQNTAKFKQQLMQMGIGIDWSREINSTDPSYYKWTQWFFKLLFDRGLAYQKESLQWWCETDKTVLANEQVEAGRCWRCNNEVTKKPLKQWFFKITDYADRLLEDLDDLDWSDAIKAMQRNWIGRKKGVDITYKIVNATQPETITTFTTHPDTNFGATFIVVAPEHPFVQKVIDGKIAPANGTSHAKEVAAYKKKSLAKSDIERQEEGRKKTGAFTGLYAKNNLTGYEMPIWVSDFVLMGFGTGAVVGVPAHDDRDSQFAREFNIPFKHVVDPVMIRPDVANIADADFKEKGKIVAIVQNEHGNILCIHWKPHLAGQLFVGGTIENGEKPEVTALREIREETGYTDLQVIEVGQETFHYKYFAHSKNVATSAKTAFVHVRLKSDKQVKTKLEATEKSNFKVEWITPDEARQITEPLHKYAFDKFIDKKVYTGEGVMVNSGKYNGLTSSETREQIAADMVKDGAAEWRVNYRIRDWLISRQRYWGAPIPIVHCMHCAAKKTTSNITINFYDQATWQALKEGVKKVESRVLNPEEPGRFFGNVKAGDTILAHNKTSGETLAFAVQEARIYKTLHDFYQDDEWAHAVSAKGQKAASFEDFEQAYATLAPDYLDRIAKNGLIAWRIAVATEAVPVPEDQLPVELPPMKTFEPSDDGRSPLARAPEWVNTACPSCGKPAKRETDTMDGFACSSWYFLRFADPHNNAAAFDPEKVKTWLPVNTYIGGAEHAVMHLLYARFWTKVMFDAGLIDFKEPFTALRNQGMILAPDGRKMSKSWGNVIAPDDLIADGYGADSIRIMEMFIAPWNQSANWSTEGLGGCFRFLNRVWTLAQEVLAMPETIGSATGDAAVRQVVHKTIKRVTDDLEKMGFNTAIAAMMEAVNDFYKLRADTSLQASTESWRLAMQTLAQLLAPYAPHMCEEIWQQFGNETSIHVSGWPVWDQDVLRSQTMTIIVQVNGKLRAKLELPTDASKDDVLAAALADENVQKFAGNKKPANVVYVAGRLINIVV